MCEKCVKRRFFYYTLINTNRATRSNNQDKLKMTNQETQIEAIESKLAAAGWEPNTWEGGRYVRVYLNSVRQYGTSNHQTYIQWDASSHNPYDTQVDEIDTLMDGATLHRIDRRKRNKGRQLEWLLREDGLYESI